MGDRDPKAADQLYTIEFNHGGVRWCFEIYAHDDDDIALPIDRADPAIMRTAASVS
jgi:hypothetical protein